MNTIINLTNEDTLTETLSDALGLLHLDDLDINIIPMPTFIRNSKKWKFLGMAYQLPTPKSYNIMVRDSLSAANKRMAVLHEAAHIKQYDDGRLERDERNNLYFEGTRIKPPYNPEHPHEVEANRVMIELDSDLRKRERVEKRENRKQKNKYIVWE